MPNHKRGIWGGAAEERGEQSQSHHVVEKAQAKWTKRWYIAHQTIEEEVLPPGDMTSMIAKSSKKVDHWSSLKPPASHAHQTRPVATEFM